MANFQIFKGGFDHAHDDRLAINQRPADGHIKPEGYEDFIRLNARALGCAENWRNLKVGDVIGIHTTLTFGVIDGLGFRVVVPEEGFRLRPVILDTGVALNHVLVDTYMYDETAENFTATATDTAVTDIVDIGSTEAYYAGYTDPAQLIRVGNATQIGFEVVALPPTGLTGDFEIESRLHMRQSVRPPADMGCC